MICSAAIAHVHPHHIASCGPGARGVSQDVLRFRRAFEPVDQNNRQAATANLFRLPVAKAENLAPGGSVHLNIDLLHRGQPVLSWKEISSNGLDVSAEEKPAG